MSTKQFVIACFIVAVASLLGGAANESAMAMSIML